MSAALATPVAEARTYVQQQAVVHADETGGGKIGNAHGSGLPDDPGHCLPGPHQARAEAARSLLGTLPASWDGSVGRYNGWAPDKRQLCWAHLLRDFTFISQSKGTAGSVGKALVRRPTGFFATVSSTHGHDRAASSESAARLRIDIELLLKQGVSCHARRWRHVRRDPELYAALWTFAVVEGVEPTNNFAREICGPQSSGAKEVSHTQRGGSRFVERMMTVVVRSSASAAQCLRTISCRRAKRTFIAKFSVPAADRRKDSSAHAARSAKRETAGLSPTGGLNGYEL